MYSCAHGCRSGRIHRGVAIWRYCASARSRRRRACEDPSANTPARFLLRDVQEFTHMNLIENKKVGFDYEILETIEAGLELLGFEVKSLRQGQGSLKGARVVARGGEAYLVGATIPAWQVKNAPKSYDPERTRRLLLNRKEIAQISSAEGEKGLTIVPINVYNKGRNLKLSIAIARGKKKEDKRHSIRAREEKRRIQRTLKTE
jgi:SsrA-binding protein